MMMDISQALKNPGQYYPFKAELELPEVEVLDDPVRFEGVSLEGTYVGGEDTVRLEGTVRAVAHTRCSDCLEPAQVALEGDFDVTFARNPDPEDPDLYPIEGYRIDIAPMAQEALLLEMPMRVLCREDCKGLCPICGQNRNIAPCTCQEGGVRQNNPFSALSVLLTEDEEV